METWLADDLQQNENNLAEYKIIYCWLLVLILPLPNNQISVYNIFPSLWSNEAVQITLEAVERKLMKSRIIRGNWDYLHFWFSVWLDRGDAPTSDKHIFHCWITKPRGKLGEFGKSSIYHWCGVYQHSHICSVRIKNYWEVYVQSWHTVFNFPLWPEGEYNWSPLFIFWGLLLIIWTKWLSRELPEILLNFAHFSLATFPPESVFNIIHIRCRKKHIWACFTWEAPLHRTHVLGLRLRQNTSTCDNSISALTPRQDLPSPRVDKWCASETRHSPGCALRVKFLTVKRKEVKWKNYPKIN